VTEGHITKAADFFVRLRRIDNAKLKTRDIVVLAAIKAQPGMMGRELALKLGYATRSNVQDCVARLIKYGYTVDKRATQDQQTPNDLHITDAGTALLAEIVPHD
jgi:DNA-binding MarR family transcriptional regulator